MKRWTDVPLDSELFQNLDESVLRRSPIVLENLFINEAKGQSRFPGLRQQSLRFGGGVIPRLPGGGAVHLNDWRGNLVAATKNGRFFRLQPDMTFEDCTGVVISGDGRITFGKTPDQLMMAAGRQIVQFRQTKTELLSETAPLSTHAVYLSGYAIAIETESQRFFYTPVGEFTNWNEIDFFSAESQPDNLTCAIVDEFGELILGGQKSVEQFEPYTGADRPFFRRWTVGQGIVAPYTLTSGDGEIWAVNELQEFVSFAGQNNKPRSLTISMVLESIDDWRGAWASKPMHLFGQKFIIIKIPNAMNEYGSRGITLLHDYKARRWAYLYGWDEANGLPAEWPGNSYHYFQGRHYVGGLNGEIYTLDNQYFLNGAVRQQTKWRSAHFDEWGKVRVDGLKLRLRRGAPSTGYDQNPDFQLRVKQDNRHWGKWQTRKLGASGDTMMTVDFGQQGNAETWQFETRCDANCPLEIVWMKALTTRVD